MTARPRKVRFVSAVFAVVFVAVFSVVAVLLRNTPTGVYFQLSDQIAMVGIGVLLACGALWLTRPRVSADAEGVTVRNLLGSTRYPWSVVQSVSFPDGAAWARLELPDDEYVPIMAVQSIDGERAVTAIRELRKLHRAQWHPESHPE
ncbi:PH domain-containing protein [Actinokineospora iranica]|uniref:PH domain-containing protein n=1 Tax=Actinokineospora iranica TaxID=1271860 RepID=A0A1G6JAX2_9PSEU|nr:PH domain-containing protein [Actinokineospora iranica]SDC15860.1 PH domain-containing protein [Actinokineospora iranica]